MNGRCLICWKPSDPKCIPVSLLERQLNAIFVLRVLLKVPPGSLSNYFHLSSGEHPSHWVNWCGECDELVENARSVYNQLLTVREQLKDFQRRISDRVKESNPIPEEAGEGAVVNTQDGDRKVLHYQQEIGGLVRTFVKSQFYGYVNPFLVGDRRAEVLVSRRRHHESPEPPQEDYSGSESFPPSPEPEEDDLDSDFCPPSPLDTEEKEEVEPKITRRSKTSDRFFCRKCGASFPTHNLRQKHKRQVHPLSRGQKPPTTKEVDFCLPATEPLIKEERDLEMEPTKARRSKTKGVFCCRKCGESFPTHALRQRHKRQVHPQPSHTRTRTTHKDRPKRVQSTFSCSYCGQSFPTYNLRETHRRRVHYQQRPLPQHNALSPKPEQDSPDSNFSASSETEGQESDSEHYPPRQKSPATKASKTRKKMKTDFRCTICGISFPTLNQRLKHWRRLHDRKSHSSTTKQDSAGLRINKTQVSFSCRLCGQSFSTYNLRQTHKRRVHYQRKHPRPPPESIYYVDPDKPRKKRNYYKKDGYICSLCGGSFPTRSRRNYHQIKEHRSQVKEHPSRVKEPTESCPLCNLKFTTHNAMIRHQLQVHQGREKITLNEVSRFYYHEKKREVQCPHCLYRGSNPRIKDHIARVHNSDPSLICDLCGKGVKVARNLRCHQANEHFKCGATDCNFMGSGTQELWEHQTSVHGKEMDVWQCPDCKKMFTRLDRLKRHGEIHERERIAKEEGAEGVMRFQCDTCGKKYSTKNSLNTHRFTVHSSKPKTSKPRSK